MKITNDSIGGKKVIFDTIIDEIVGGASLNVTRLDNLTHNDNVDKRWLKAGAPVYFDHATRVAELCKTAKYLGGTSTAIRVYKEHHFKVGDFLNDGTNCSLIESIDSSNAAYDVLNVNSALATTGTVYFEGTVTGTNATLAYTPNGLLKNDAWIYDGNASAEIVTMGTVREDALTYFLPALYKVALRGGTAGTGTSLITVN